MYLGEVVFTLIFALLNKVAYLYPARVVSNGTLAAVLGLKNKAKGAGMWDFALDELGVADKAACNARSCYVGDSDADENLARVAGVRYHHVRDYFGAMFPRP